MTITSVILIVYLYHIAITRYVHVTIDISTICSITILVRQAGDQLSVP